MNWDIQSSMPGIAWPAVPGTTGARTLALLLQLESSQWLSGRQLLARQLGQMQILLQHAQASVPWYRERWQNAFNSRAPLTAESVAALPILTRRDLQENFTSLQSTHYPSAHGSVNETRSSGSTGTPVRALNTALTALIWNVITLRDHQWHQRDLKGSLAAIRHGVPHATAPDWGRATYGLLNTGPAHTAPIAMDIGTQLQWLKQHNPEYLMTYPSIVRDLAKLTIESGTRLENLREVRTFGELLPADLRDLCREAWNAPVTDVYSAVETGYIALQCPLHPHYHVQSESLYVEVIDDEGNACKPGGTGRVVVTTLHNFAMPLIRYALGDYAEVGEPCDCGRGLPVLRRVLGRARNILVTPGGQRYWPAFGSHALATIGSIAQHQMVQIAPDHIEARLVLKAPLTADEETRLRGMLQSRLPEGFRLSIAYKTHIPRGPTGKFEDFVSFIPA